jgi:hypothetical protein
VVGKLGWLVSSALKVIGRPINHDQAYNDALWGIWMVNLEVICLCIQAVFASQSNTTIE